LEKWYDGQDLKAVSRESLENLGYATKAEEMLLML